MTLLRRYPPILTECNGNTFTHDRSVALAMSVRMEGSRRE